MEEKFAEEMVEHLCLAPPRYIRREVLVEEIRRLLQDFLTHKEYRDEGESEPCVFDLYVKDLCRKVQQVLMVVTNRFTNLTIHAALDKENLTGCLMSTIGGHDRAVRNKILQWLHLQGCQITHDLP